MPRHATGLHAVQTGHQSVAPPRSATASRCAPSQGSRLLGIAPAPAAAPWFRPPERVGNHVNILSTTVVLSSTLSMERMSHTNKRLLLLPGERIFACQAKIVTCKKVHAQRVKYLCHMAFPF